jgi:ribosomal protein S18 acetylase RimI-like enzyme
VNALRPARDADAPALARIARAAYAPYVAAIGTEPPPMHQDFGADIPARRVWVTGDPPEGFVVAYAKEGDWHIENVAVAPEAQGRGIGRALIAGAEALGRAAGHDRVTLYTNRAMTGPLELYPRLGYTRAGEEVVGRLHRVHFIKELG